MPASADFNGGQLLTLINNSTGPHKNLTYPFSMIAIMRRTASSGVGYLGAIGRTGFARPFAMIRSSSAELPVATISNTTSTTAITGTTNMTDIWGVLCFVVTSATSYAICWNGTSEASGTASRDVLASTSVLDITCIGASFDQTQAHVGQIAFFGMYNRGLSAAEQLEIRYNPWVFSKDQVCKYFLLNTISAASDCKDQGGGGYNMTGGTVPSASLNGPAIFMDAGGCY